MGYVKIVELYNGDHSSPLWCDKKTFASILRTFGIKAFKIHGLGVSTWVTEEDAAMLKSLSREEIRSARNDYFFSDHEQRMRQAASDPMNATPEELRELGFPEPVHTRAEVEARAIALGLHVSKEYLAQFPEDAGDIAEKG